MEGQGKRLGDRPFPLDELPTEIRLLIWQAALDVLGYSSHCVHVLGNNSGKSPWLTSYDPVRSVDIDRSAHRNPLMYVNRESREQCLAGGREMVDLSGAVRDEWRSPPVLINWQTDTLYLHPSFFYALPDILSHCSWGPSVQRLACTSRHLCYDLDLMAVLQQLKSLRELIVLPLDHQMLLLQWLDNDGPRLGEVYRLALAEGCSLPSEQDGLSSIDVLAGTFAYKNFTAELKPHIDFLKKKGRHDPSPVRIRYAIDLGRGPAVAELNLFSPPKYERASWETIRAILENPHFDIADGKKPQYASALLGDIVCCPDPEGVASTDDYSGWRDSAEAIISQ